jgi:hypothetical protein
VRRLGLTAAIALAAMTAGCGGSDGGGEIAAPPPAPSAQEARVEQEPAVSLSVSRPPGRIKGDDVAIVGTVTPGSRVTIRGRRAKVRDDGRFRLRLGMRVGTNRFTVVARQDGYRTSRRPLRIRRSAPPPPPPEPAPAATPAPTPAPAAPGAPEGFSSSNCDGPSTASGECLPGSTPLPQEYPEHNIDQIPEVPGNQGE